MFAFFAFSGDLGCTLGPDLIGIVSDAVVKNGGTFTSFLSGDATSVGLKVGILTALVFPIMGILASLSLTKIMKKNEASTNN